MAAGSAAAILLTGLAAGTASAAPGGLHATRWYDSVPLVGGVTATSIDDTKDASLTLHKFESGSLNGFEIAKPDKNTYRTEGIKDKGTPVPGAEFTVYRAQLSIKDSNNWKTVAALAEAVPANACQTPTSVGGVTFDQGIPLGETQADGSTATKTLKQGFYLVCETKTPPEVLKAAAPFIVALPYPHHDAKANTSQWIYDVHAYPKNTVVKAPIKKFAQIEGAGVGARVTFTVETTIPSIADNESFSKYWIMDNMPAELENGTVTAVTIDNQAADGTHYARKTSATNPNYVGIYFTKDGLAHLKGQKNKKILVTFTATIKTVPANGQINNTAYAFVDTAPGMTPPNDPNTPPDTPPTPDTPGATPPVNTLWGELSVRKIDQDSPSVLPGAEFKLYEADTQDQDCTSTVTKGNPITATYKGTQTDTFVTDTDGRLLLSGLYVNHSEKAEKAVGGDWTYTYANGGRTHRCYVLVETKAPAGYVLPDQPNRAVKVLWKNTPQDVTKVDVPNKKQSFPALPMTGANGQTVVAILGVAFLSAAAGVFLLARRRRSSSDER